MPGQKQSVGACVFCGREMTRSGLSNHLATCEKRAEAIRAADASKNTPQKLLHLLVKDAYSSDYWLHLEMNGAATLERLDAYLRAIWLECCGHLSQFSIGGWEGDEIPIGRKIERVFASGVELTHIYDFGTPSISLIKSVGVREGRPLTRHPIFLMARNQQPERSCKVCGEPATHYCVECLIEEETETLLCARHAAEHPHQENYGEPMVLVNSPRVGLCGYEGPAEPPY